jgi:hypothetical protein
VIQPPRATVELPPPQISFGGDAGVEPAAQWVLASLKPLPKPADFMEEPKQVRAPADALADGYWILTRAGVWEEDLRPDWRQQNLTIVGTVEDEAARTRVVKAITQVATGRPVILDIRPRETGVDLPVPSSHSATRRAEYHPGGGVVRNALLAHFSDAARRSFQSPRPALLEAEIDLYDTEDLSAQTQLLSHANAL